MTEAEFNRVYAETSDKVLSGILRIVHNEAVAEELLQDTYLQFLRLAEKESVASVKGLLFRISHNLAVDFVRKDARVENRADSDATVAPSAQNDLEYRVLRRSIIERLSREDERLLKFYILTIDYAMHIEEVAAELGVSRRSAFRLRDQLKAILVEFL